MIPRLIRMCLQSVALRMVPQAANQSRRQRIARCLPLLIAMLCTVAHAGPSSVHKPEATVLVLGDSLSAEYGLQKGEGWVALLAQRLQKEHLNYQVVNASISGETTAGGRNRIADLLLQHHPAVVVIDLGAIDALRGLPLPTTRAYLDAIAQQSMASGALTLIVGMQVPPNYGQKYNADFAQVFKQSAATHKAGLVPFLLRGIADAPHAEQLFQADRIHPLAIAHPQILANVWPGLHKLLK